MNSLTFVNKLIDIATNYKTCYGKGMWGRYLNATAIKEMSKYYGDWYKKYTEHFESLYDKDYWAFDCCCLVKSVCSGWCADKKKTLGGAVYPNKDVPDDTTEGMIEKCSGVSEDFSNIIPGELLWKKGHVGVYIGDGKAVECTLSIKRENGQIVEYVRDGVIISAVSNIKRISGLPYRSWTAHGKLPYINYVEKPKIEQPIEVENKPIESKPVVTETPVTETPIVVVSPDTVDNTITTVSGNVSTVIVSPTIPTAPLDEVTTTTTTENIIVPSLPVEPLPVETTNSQEIKTETSEKEEEPVTKENVIAKIIKAFLEALAKVFKK